MDLSIVTTLYHSGPYLREFHARAIRAAATVTDDYEILMVNDGCPADSLAVACQLIKEDSHVRVLDLSRNFGHHQAMHTGLRNACGDRVFLIDCDLEEPPEALVSFWKKLDADPELDVVFGVQPKRKGSIFKRLTGGLFDWVFNMLSGTKIDRNSLHLRLMTRPYVDAIAELNEQDLFLVGLFALVGFNQAPHEVAKSHKEQTNYTIRRKVNLFKASLTSFSSVPLKLSFFMGFLVAAVAFTYVVWEIFRVLVLGHSPPEGWASLMVSIWFLAGVILMAIGVLGAYVSRIYTQVKNRPTSIVRRVYQNLERDDKQQDATKG